MNGSRKYKAGAVAGTVDETTGYIVIEVDGKEYNAQDLAWMYVHGVWPKGKIQHINGIKTDNRLANLRDDGST